jgi:hypothetical protein
MSIQRGVSSSGTSPIVATLSSQPSAMKCRMRRISS